MELYGRGSKIIRYPLRDEYKYHRKKIFFFYSLIFDNVPQDILDEAKVRIRLRGEIIELKVELNEIRQMLIQKHRNPSTALRTNDPL